MKKWSIAIIALFPVLSYAVPWSDFFLTADQQAQQLYQQKKFNEASQRFQNPSWQAASHYRAGDYKTAAGLYQSLGGADGFYNQGNALASLKQYQEALNAYNKALAIDPHHQDATYNKKIVEELLKQQKQNQDKKNQDQQNQGKQDQDKQDQSKQGQGKQDQNKPDQNKPDQNKPDQNKPDQNKPDQGKPDQGKPDQGKPDQGKPDQGKPDQDKPDQGKPDQDKPDQGKPDQDKPDEDKPDQGKPDQSKQDQNEHEQQNSEKNTSGLSNQNKEEQRANEQWLQLVPDDPGGLLREKFLRDHQKREQGWNP